jgi:hypothetical protein
MKPGPGCLYIWPPRVARSSTNTVCSPWPAAAAAAARPAGPPPITSRSQPAPAVVDVSVPVPGQGQAGIGGKVDTPSVLLYAAAKTPDFWALQSQVFR